MRFVRFIGPANEVTMINPAQVTAVGIDPESMRTVVFLPAGGFAVADTIEDACEKLGITE